MPSKTSKSCESQVPTRPFRVLEAPCLRNDFYCSALAYSCTSGFLAVGLGSRVYLWSESDGVRNPPFTPQHPSNFVSSVSFSSEQGERSILAVGRRSGRLTLWSVFESEPRFEINQPNGISCVAFKQATSRRSSERFVEIQVDTEELAVGDELGNLWYYSVEWPDEISCRAIDWHGSMTLLAKISAHTQNICGITWSPDGIHLATGGNDNACLIFDLRDIFRTRTSDLNGMKRGVRQSPNRLHRGDRSRPAAGQSARESHGEQSFLNRLTHSVARSQTQMLSSAVVSQRGCLIYGGGRTIALTLNSHKRRLTHAAAVKAIAFAPWQPSLLATGGGANDRAIHFYHAPSGICLASMNVYAQVTSLIWSKARPEIVATFGFSQPEHPYRIAVFAWPSCEQIAAIPWADSEDNGQMGDCGRALWAISYPGPDDSKDQKVDDGHGMSNSVEAQDIRTSEGQRQNARIGRSPNPTFGQPKEKEGGLWCPRTVDEGCIIVASSDQTVRFYEVWKGPRGHGIAATPGLLGGSDILEHAEGIEKQYGNEVIR